MISKGKEVKVTCTLGNTTCEINIAEDISKLIFDSISINDFIECLASVYRGPEKKALIALRNILQETDQKISNHQDSINEKGQEKNFCIEINTKYFFHLHEKKLINTIK